MARVVVGGVVGGRGDFENVREVKGGRWFGQLEISEG